MSRQDRVLLVLGLIVAVGLVIYPLAYRISTDRDSANAAESTRPAGAGASTAPTPARTRAASSIAPTPRAPTPLPIRPWAAAADEHRGADGESFEYVCPPDGTFGEVWGTDTYTDDSSVCTAGVHRGVITRERGGRVTIIIRPALESYQGSVRHGVATLSFGPWFGSYVVVSR